MPALTNEKPYIRPWTSPSPTSFPLEWAPLTIIDLAEYDAPGGKESLTRELFDSIKHWGFWTVINSGISQEEMDRQFSIMNEFFHLPHEEKREWVWDVTVGNSFGYREPSRFVGNTNVKDNMEILNIPKFTDDYASIRQHTFLQAFHDEIKPFHQKVWEKVIKKLLVFFAIMLELPEEYFVNLHQYESPSEDHIRCIMYHPRDIKDDELVGDVWLAGHTDFGSLTLLFSQPVSGLQILTPNNEWKWIKYLKGSIVCNAGDTLSFLTKGYIKSCIHRVVRPPPDQVNAGRLGMFYFCRPGNTVPLIPAPSPVLRENFITEEDLKMNPEDAVTGFEYVRSRTQDVHDRKKSRQMERGVDAQFRVGNLAVKDHYI